MPDMETADKYDRADYLHRFCSDADWGIPPFSQQVQALASKDWKKIFDEFPIVRSESYHALRDLFGWEPVRVKKDLFPDNPLKIKWVKQVGRGTKVFEFEAEYREPYLFRP